MVRIGVLFTRVRVEEKLIVEALRRRGVEPAMLHDEMVVLRLDRPWTAYDVVLSRSLGHWRALHALCVLEAWGLPTLNPARVVEICGNKLLTTACLVRARLPVPRTAVAFSAEAARQAAEELGYPVVAKPVIGSWGRLLARLVSPEQAEAVLEHKAALSSPLHHVYYLQEYVDKPGRDIRSFVVGGETICARCRTEGGVAGC